MSESLIFAHFSFFGERCEWIAHFAQIIWAMWANRSGCSPKMSDHKRFAHGHSEEMTDREQIVQVAHFLTKNEQFARKSNERIPSPALNTSLVSIKMLVFALEAFQFRAWLIGSWALYHPTLVQCHSSMWSGPVGSPRSDSTLLQGPMQQVAISSSTKL